MGVNRGAASFSKLFVNSIHEQLVFLGTKPAVSRGTQLLAILDPVPPPLPAVLSASKP